jgi:hypothetical protein
MTALVLDKPDYDVLNAVTLKKMAEAPGIADVCGRPAGEVAEVLAGLASHGLVAMAGEAALPTDEAEPALAEAAAQHYAAVRTDPEIGELVDRFETVNDQFLAAMSSWQQVDVGGRKVANDHSDSAYDDKVIAKIDKLIQRLTALLEALARHDPRFSTYQRRFATAMDAIDAGEHDLVSSPTADSVHNIWFEFHEDLLRTLGRARKQ